MRADNYKDFAKAYDEATTTNNDEKIVLFKRLIQKYPSKGNNLLELGCGTGTILQAFADGYSLTGLDLSQPMLDVAAEKIPNARLVQGDITDFDLGQKFDVILCVFDTINHLLQFSEWEQTLHLTLKHLEKGGLFIFDINTMRKLENFTQAQKIEQDTRQGHLTAGVQKLRLGVYEWKMRLGDRLIEIAEAAFPVSEVNNLASKYFQVVEMVTDDGQPADETADKVYFVCQDLPV
jgi:predicted TPR repeat methyltransferase